VLVYQQRQNSWQFLQTKQIKEMEEIEIVIVFVIKMVFFSLTVDFLC
jgi:hypothetical protein